MDQATVVDRLSTASKDNVDTVNAYKEVKTPDGRDNVESGGALRPGGAPNLYSIKNIGLLAQYAAVGVVYGSLWAVIYPFLNNYLRMSGVKTASASALLALPWTWKMFFGIISDCFPIWGYRRRPYMVIGWFVCFVSCLIMACMPIGDPYYPDPALAYIPPGNLTEDQVASINTDAPSSGTLYISLLTLANFGIVLALTASDGILVAYAQREPENVRGTTQTMICISQDLFQCLSAAMIGFGLNDADYGGSFSSSIGMNGIMGVCAFFSLLIIPVSWFCATEEVTEPQSASALIKSIYNLIQQRVVYQIIAFRFFRNVFSNFTVTAALPIQSTWAKVEPINNSIATILGYLLSSLGWWLTKKYGLNWDWRIMIGATQLAVVAIDSIPTMLTIWDVHRSQWFWLGVPLLENLPYSVGYVVTTFCVIEIIQDNNEAAVYGLISTVSTLASPFSTVLTKNVDAHFDIGTEYLQVDDNHAKTQATYAYIIAYAFKLCSVAFVLLLPRQKAETQELKRNGGSSKIVGIATIVYLLFAFIWSTMTNVMSFSTSTSCLTIAGGNGCS